MKALKFFTLFCVILFSLYATACNDDGGGSSGTGTATVSITDAKPLLPEEVTNLFVTIEEVLVHKSGGGWTSLPLVESPYTIDLLQFHDGNVTELVPPTKLKSGKYTQVRLVVSSAEIVFDNEESTAEEEPVTVPSENLKTDKNFIFDVEKDSAVDLIIHFDLSMSVVVSGPELDPSYSLKPVLHLFGDQLPAATIEGRIDNSSFDSPEDKATITVIAESNGEIFTRVEISQSDTTETDYSIFWIVPNQKYRVEIDINQDSSIDCEITIGSVDDDGDDFDSPDHGEVVDIGTCS